MDDLLDDAFGDPRSGRNEPEYSVSEISGAVKRALEDQFGRVRVRGEIGRIFRARSGHLYYDVKDDRNVLACTTWKGQIAQLSVAPEEGMEVVVTGKLSGFGAQSKYNLNVDEMRVAGAGALMAMLEKRRAALAAEGLFDAARKRPLPFLPDVIGVVTSPQGAVIRDILHRLRDRFPRRVLVWPVAVQGKACAPEVAAAIRGFNALAPGGPIPRPDLLIVARGGGSIEDLWGFNEEAVVRAAVESAIPLISAVGHETDTTLLDHAADRRAPTPTAAAEMAVPVRADLVALVDGLGGRMRRAAGLAVRARAQRLGDVGRGLPRPASLLDRPRARLDRAGSDLPRALRGGTQRARLALSRLGGRITPAALRAQAVEARGRLDRAARALHAARTGRVVRLRARLDVLRLPPADRVTRYRRRALDAAARRLTSLPLRRRADADRRRLDAGTARLAAVARAENARLRAKLGALDRLRASLGPEETLRRGYAVVRDEDGVVTTAERAREAARLEIEFRDGRVTTGGGRTARPRVKAGEPPASQGSLF